MYLLYLDESGSVPNPNEEYFVIGGVCVPERSIKWLTDQADDLAAKIDKDNPGSIEFHASEIFAGRISPWNNMGKNDRKSISKDLLSTLEGAGNDTVIFACAIKKADFHSGHDLIKMAFEDICSRFDMFLNRMYHKEKYSHKGLIIFDKNSYTESLEKLSFEFRQTGTKWRDLRNIREVPFFVDSKSSRIIQIADHISYAVFRRYNADDLTFFNCIENRFDEHEGTIHGLSHKQTSKSNCTCPACITRR